MKSLIIALAMMALLAGTAAARNQPNNDAETEAFMKTYNQATNDAGRRFKEATEIPTKPTAPDGAANAKVAKPAKPYGIGDGPDEAAAEGIVSSGFKRGSSFEDHAPSADTLQSGRNLPPVTWRPEADHILLTAHHAPIIHRSLARPSPPHPPQPPHLTPRVIRLPKKFVGKTGRGTSPSLVDLRSFQGPPELSPLTHP